MKRTRSRALSLHHDTGIYAGAYVYNSPRTNFVSGTQVTTDELHDWNGVPAKKKSEWDRGGPFSSTTPYVIGKPGTYVHVGAGGYQSTPPWGRAYMYNGWIYPAIRSAYNDLDFNSLLLDGALADDIELMSYGTTAISRCAPTNPVADVSTFFGELKKDGLPKLMGAAAAGSRGRRISSVGSEYLNHEFAVKPFVSDLHKFHKAAKESSKILEQLERDSGKLVRRRYDFPFEETVIEKKFSTTDYPSHLANSYFWTYGGSLGTTSKTTTRRTKRWFSGAFTYHYVTGEDTMSKLRRNEQRLHRLYGSLNIATAWNLMPWSWAVDWATNAGDVVKNISLFTRDGLVMKYGYVMEESSVERTILTTGARFSDRATLWSGTPRNLPPLQLTYGVRTKRRLKATPFGFGVQMESLSLRQQAILGALGLSRSRV